MALLKLQDEGYGVEEGIPSLVLAAASLDDVFSVEWPSLQAAHMWAKHVLKGLL